MSAFHAKHKTSRVQIVHSCHLTARLCLFLSASLPLPPSFDQFVSVILNSEIVINHFARSEEKQKKNRLKFSFSRAHCSHDTTNAEKSQPFDDDLHYYTTSATTIHFLDIFSLSLSVAFGLFLYARLACVQSINDSNSAQPTVSQRHTRKVKSGRSQILSTNSLSFTLAHHLQTHTHSLSLQLQKNPSTPSSRLRL